MDKHINLLACTYYILYCDSDYRRGGGGGVQPPAPPPQKKNPPIFAVIYVSLLAWDLLAIKLTLNVCTYISSNDNILHQLHRYNVSVSKLNTIIYIYGCQSHEYLASFKDLPIMLTKLVSSSQAKRWSRLYLSVTIISGYKFTDFQNSWFSGYINFSDFIISSSDTYQVLSGFPTVFSNDEPSQNSK